MGLPGSTSDDSGLLWRPFLKHWSTGQESLGGPKETTLEQAHRLVGALLNLGGTYQGISLAERFLAYMDSRKWLMCGGSRCTAGDRQGERCIVYISVGFDCIHSLILDYHKYISKQQYAVHIPIDFTTHCCLCRHVLKTA